MSRSDSILIGVGLSDEDIKSRKRNIILAFADLRRDTVSKTRPKYSFSSNTVMSFDGIIEAYQRS